MNQKNAQTTKGGVNGQNRLSTNSPNFNIQNYGAPMNVGPNSTSASGNQNNI